MFWFLHRDLFVSQNSVPILDGIITPLLSHSPAKILKAILVVIIMFSSLVFGYYNFRRKQFVGMFVAVALLIMCVLVNAYEIWVVVRYSKLLIVPLLFVDTKLLKMNIKWKVIILIIFLATNLFFSFYQARL
jgi:hypothetical protein